MRSIDPKLTAILAGVVGVVLGLAGGVSISSGISYQADLDTAAQERNNAPIPAPAVILDYSPEVDAWHREAGDIIADLVWLSGPLVGDYTEARVSSLCERFSLVVARLDEVPTPPSSPLDQYLEDWIIALKETEEACTRVPERLGAQGFNVLMQRHAYEMLVFLLELETKIDLRTEPQRN